MYNDIIDCIVTPHIAYKEHGYMHIAQSRVHAITIVLKYDQMKYMLMSTVPYVSMRLCRR